MFENEEYRIRNGIFEAYLGDKKKISISPKICDCKVNAIGKNAFLGKELDSVIIREGIEQIEEEAFSRARIKSLILPTTITNIGENLFLYELPQNIIVSRKMSRARWNRIKNTCIPTANGAFLLTNNTGEKCIDTFIDIYSQKSIFARDINENMMTLFSYADNREDVVFENKKIKSKNVMVKYLIRNEMYTSVSEKVDRADDYNFRKAGSARAQNVVLCKLSIDEDRVGQDFVLVKAHFIKGIYYWMRIEKIVLDKKNYYIASKEFLNPNDDIPYLKKVENVYDDLECEVNETTKKKVFRKYNLLRNIP